MRFFRQIGELKGWRRFGFEVAIIVVGLGITLIAQELITSADRAREMHLATDAVETELTDILFSTSERLAVEPCRREQIRALAERLQDSSDRWAAEIPEGINRDNDFFVLPRIVRTPQRSWPDEAWMALRASDNAIYMDRDQFTQLSGIFRQVARLRERQDSASQLAGRLSHLNMAGQLDEAQRREAYALLGEFAAIEGGSSVIAGQVRDVVLEFDFRNQDRFAEMSESELGDAIGRMRQIYGACVDATQMQPYIDEFNAATGGQFAIDSAATGP